MEFFTYIDILSCGADLYINITEHTTEKVANERVVKEKSYRLFSIFLHWNVYLFTVTLIEV